MNDPLTKRARRVVNLARDIARRFGITRGGDLVVLIAILEDNGGVAATVLKEMGLDLRALYAQLPPTPLEAPPDSSAEADIARVVALATVVAAEREAAELGTEHLLFAMVRDTESAACAMLLRFNITYELIQATIERLVLEQG